MNRPDIPRPEKPKVGFLYYGTRKIAGPDTFLKLGAEQKKLISIGYDEKLFRKRYF